MAHLGYFIQIFEEMTFGGYFIAHLGYMYLLILLEMAFSCYFCDQSLESQLICNSLLRLPAPSDRSFEI
jgi:hypothetical protein